MMFISASRSRHTNLLPATACFVCLLSCLSLNAELPFGSQKCVFILATGRSGSTSLMDALNQIPHYLIRGETWRAHGNLFDAYQHLCEARTSPGQEFFHFANIRERYIDVKLAYGKLAETTKLPFFNEFSEDRILLATRAYYTVLYGHYGKDVVTGFKEIRYVCGELYFNQTRCGEHFQKFVRFLRGMCHDVKFLFNTRLSASLESNVKRFQMFNNATFAADFTHLLNETHTLYDNYAMQHSDHAFRVYMEDMFNIKRNATLARNLLQFLGEDTTIPIRFNRMPGWQPSYPTP
ncbi:hypothetical protein Agub_g12088 [Astrephomene gubernaculifera]|uniref:Sulfotransferase n=1 Tax=Astrephomene gubernaculifera TaxID=47775 RepID=A0AAD3E296_9CHLO|nr:hypothetical protein Agub_g12088 [Astrephomene gubernaculifera]